jgi:hypothetical protein
MPLLDLARHGDLRLDPGAGLGEKGRVLPVDRRGVSPRRAPEQCQSLLRSGDRHCYGVAPVEVPEKCQSL